MAYITSDLSGFKKKFKRLTKKIVKAPVKLTKKVVKAPVKIAKKTVRFQHKLLKKAVKPVATVALAPIAIGTKFVTKTAKMGAGYMMPAPATISEPIYPDFAPSLPMTAPVSTQSYVAPVSTGSDDAPSIDYPGVDEMNDLERPMTNEQIRQYVEAQQDAGETVDGLNGFMDKLKKIVKKAAVVVATVKGGPVAGRKVYDALLSKKGTSPDQAAVVYESGNQAVSQGIPRAVGEKAANSFFSGKNIAIGGAAILGVGLLAFLITRKR